MKGGRDIEIVEDDQGTTRPQIRKGVAPDRVISTVDTDARHGHRSRADRYDGYKLHVSADLDSDLICAAGATLASTHDAVVLDDLIETDPLPVATIIADTHYGSGPVRQHLADTGVELVAPAPPPSPAKKGMLSKNDFDIDLEAGTVTCPAGQQTAIPPPAVNGKRRQVRFDSDICTACESKPVCTTRSGGRILEINPHEALLAEARAKRWDPEFLDRYRQRAMIERKIAQVKNRAAKLPWRGLTKANTWIQLRTAALNLDRIGRLGVTG